MRLQYPCASHKMRPKWNTNLNLIITHPVLSLIESCNSMPELRQIHAHMTRTGLIAHRFPASRILAFCALSDSGDIDHAHQLFTRFPQPNTYMWNTMIRGYTRVKSPLLGVSLFRQMLHQQAETDARTFVFALKSCEQLREVFVGEEVHCIVCKLGFSSDLLVQNGLMHFYLVHERLVSARQLFDRMPERDVVSWTTLIDGYAQKGFPDEALRLFLLVLYTGLQPNDVTMIAVLSACSQAGVLRLGVSIHGFIVKGRMNGSINLMNALVDMYGKCGDVNSAREVFDNMETKDVFSWSSMMNAFAKGGDLGLARRVFDEMPERNAVTWSNMIAAYSQTNRAEEALSLFREMIMSCVEPIHATLVSVLSACAQSGCLDLGRWIYCHFIEGRRVEPSVKLTNAFIDMYAKCGMINAAEKLFDEMSNRDIESWNSMILAYAYHGYGHKAISLFNQLRSERMVPDEVTFVSVLSACSHAGLVAEGRRHFKDMKMVFGIEPNEKHYACLVDLLGRAGLLEDAYELVRSMPMEPDEAGWGALLNACKMHARVDIGESAGDKLLRLDPGDSGIYALLSNMYAARNEWDDVKKMKRMMRERGIKKNPGCSSIEVNGKSHEFFVADKSHLLSDEIYTVLDKVYLHLKWEGYILKM